QHEPAVAACGGGHGDELASGDHGRHGRGTPTFSIVPPGSTRVVEPATRTAVRSTRGSSYAGRMPRLVLLLLALPVIELLVVIRVGQVIGAGWTILLLVLASVLGAWLVRRAGRRAWRAFREAREDARWPGHGIAEGVLVIIGGTLLLAPGFITDVLGVLLVLPLTRRSVARFLEGRVVPAPIRTVGTRVFAGRSVRAEREADVIEVEVIRIEREEV